MGVQDRGRAPLGHELRWCRHYLNAALTVSNRYADPSNCFTEASTRRHQNGLRIDPVSSAARVPPLFQFVLEPSERVRARSRGFPAAVRQGRAQRLDDCGARRHIRPETGRVLGFDVALPDRPDGAPRLDGRARCDSRDLAVYSAVQTRGIRGRDAVGHQRQ